MQLYHLIAAIDQMETTEQHPWIEIETGATDRHHAGGQRQLSALLNAPGQVARLRRHHGHGQPGFD